MKSYHLVLFIIVTSTSFHSVKTFDTFDVEDDDDNDDENVFEFNVNLLDTKLQVKPLLIIRDQALSDIFQCLARCLEHSPLCNGVNFHSNDIENEGVGSVCEILEDHYDDYDTRKKLICAQHWIYYAMSQISVGTFIQYEYFCLNYIYFKRLLTDFNSR